MRMVVVILLNIIFFVMNIINAKWKDDFDKILLLLKQNN